MSEPLDAAGLRAVIAGFRDGLRAPPGGRSTGSTSTRCPTATPARTWPSPSSRSWASSTATGDDADLATSCKAISHGSLMGARGNSGVILSQILRGFASTVEEAGHLDGPALATALATASDAAYGAVMKPVEGTILTVVREAAEGAGACRTARASSRVAEAAADAGRIALGPHARAAPGARRGRRGRRGRSRVPAAPRRRAPRRRRPADARADGRGRDRRPSGDRPGARGGRGARRRQRPPLRGHVLPRGDRRGHPHLQARVGRHRRLDRRRRAATASGTATSTPTTSAPASRPPSTAAGPGTSASPTCWSRSRRSGGSARAARRSCRTSGRAPSP